MRGSHSVRVFVLMLSVGLTGVVWCLTSQQAFGASVSDTKRNWVQLESGTLAVAPEDIHAIAAKSNGALVVGTAGTNVIIRTDDTYVLDATGTTADLLAAHCWDSWCLVSGIDIVALNRYDGGGWFDLVDTAGSGAYYTPALGTSDRAFFGWPDLSLVSFSYPCFETYDSTPGMCRMVSSPIVALTEVPSGIRGVTKFGDIYEWPIDLTSETVI